MGKTRQTRIRWLLDELDELVASEVLSASAAERLRRHYAPRLDDSSKTRELFFAVLGTLLIGGGIILLLAHNWSDLSRATRTVLSFLPLLGAQGLAAWVLLRRDARPWREGAALALCLAVASSIALIGQTYHIPGDLHGFLWTWMLLSLPMIYLFDASAVAVLYLATTAGWTFTALDAAEWPPIGYLALLGALLPWLVPRLRALPLGGRAALLGWAFALSVPLAYGALTAKLAPGIWVPAFALIFGWLTLAGAALATGGEAVRGTRWPRAPLLVVGSLGGVGLALVLSYEESWRWVAGELAARPASPAVITVWLLLALLLGHALWLWHRVLTRRDLPLALFGALIPIGVGAYLVAIGPSHPSWSTLGPALIFNLYLALLGIGLIRAGWRGNRQGLMNAGLGLLALLIVLRFFDSGLPLLARGVAFVLVGVGFLVANRALARRASRRAGGGEGESP